MLTQLRDCDKHFSFMFKGQLFFLHQCVWRVSRLFCRTEKKTKEMMMNSERSFLVGDVANMKRSMYSCITNDMMSFFLKLKHAQFSFTGRNYLIYRQQYVVLRPYIPLNYLKLIRYKDYSSVLDIYFTCCA